MAFSSIKPILGAVKRKKTGERQVQIRCIDERIPYYLATGVFIKPKFWDKKACVVNSEHPEHEQYNETIKKWMSWVTIAIDLANEATEGSIDDVRVYISSIIENEEYKEYRKKRPPKSNVEKYWFERGKLAYIEESSRLDTGVRYPGNIDIKRELLLYLKKEAKDVSIENFVNEYFAIKYGIYFKIYGVELNIIFNDEPQLFPNKGDEILWGLLKFNLGYQRVSLTILKFVKLITDEIEAIVNHKLDTVERRYIKVKNTGGISGEYFSPAFWKTDIIPILTKRYIDFCAQKNHHFSD